jgi:drug/metabolite transporter (DMT)-like permease
VITALFSAAGLAGFNIWQKIAVETIDEFTVTLQSHLLPIPVLVGTVFLTPTVIPKKPVIGLIVLSGLSNAASYYLLAKALKREDVSIIAPLRAILPILLAFIEPLIFGFSYRSIILIASILTASGIYVLLSEDEFLAPIKNLERRGIQYGFLSPIVIILAVFSDRFAFTVYGANPLTYSFFIVVSTTIALLIIFAFKDFNASLRTAITPTKKTLPLGFFRGLAIFSALYSISLTTGTNLTIVNQLGLLLPVVIGGLSFNEKYTVRRIIGAVAVICGSLLVIVFA